MINAQEWLDANYPKEKRSKVRELFISGKELESSLDLRDFCNLEKLDCSFNQLTNLNLTNLTELERFECSDNYLNDLDYSFLNSDKLTFLNVSNNNLAKSDSSVFSRF